MSGYTLCVHCKHSMFKFRECGFVLYGLLQWHGLLTEVKSWSVASNDVACGSSLAAFHLTVQLVQSTTLKRVCEKRRSRWSSGCSALHAFRRVWKIFIDIFNCVSSFCAVAKSKSTGWQKRLTFHKLVVFMKKHHQHHLFTQLPAWLISLPTDMPEKLSET
jgi:hypothetical protein